MQEHSSKRFDPVTSFPLTVILRPAPSDRARLHGVIQELIRVEDRAMAQKEQQQKPARPLRLGCTAPAAIQVRVLFPDGLTGHAEDLGGSRLVPPVGTGATTACRSASWAAAASGLESVGAVPARAPHASAHSHL